MKQVIFKNSLDFSGLKLYLDMDGVIANFIDNYLHLAEKLNIKYNGSKTDNSANPILFKIAVLEHSIFQTLPLMPSASLLIEHLKQIQVETGLQVEMLTSVNSHEDEIAAAASLQKSHWLEKNEILWKANFVRTNTEKSDYATLSTLLIDDNHQCTQPFLARNGYAILYDSFDHSFTNNLHLTLNKMHAAGVSKAD